VRARNVEQGVNNSLPAHADPVTDNSQWSAAYTYDAAGNLLTRTDANNVTATYAYDALSRSTQVTYSGYPNGTAVVQRFYDNPDASKLGKGRPWYSVSYNYKWEQPTDNLAYHRTIIEGYDALGRPTSQTQGMLYKNPAISNWDWQDYRVQRTYDLAGNVLSQTYPSNRSVTYGYNAAGQLSSFTGTLGDGNSRNYATGILYSAAGLMTKEAFGMQAATLYRRAFYNSRLQAYNITLGTGTSDAAADANSPTTNAVWDRGRLVNFYGSGDFTAWGTSGTNNNGNVLRAHHYVPTTGSNYDQHYWDYSYDALNRLTLMVEQRSGSHGSGEQFRQGFSYDRWGNRAIDLNNTTAGVAGVTRDTLTFSTATNRLTAITLAPTYTTTINPAYDSNGNQTSDGAYSRWFDAENKLTKANNAGGANYYYYDAGGKRVRRVVGTQEHWQVYGLDGELVAEYLYAGPGQPAPTTAQREYGYRSGQLLIVADNTGSPTKVEWLVSDHLGTPRINVRGTGADGGALASVTRHDYLAFGEEIGSAVGGRGNPQQGYGSPADGVRQQFTGYERDTETGLDFAQARYYTSIQGRFTSPDPLLASARPTLPQSWNRYTYVLNNPLRLTDPSGLDAQDPQEDDLRRQQQELERQRQELQRQREEFSRTVPVSTYQEQIAEPEGSVTVGFTLGVSSLSENGLRFIAQWEAFVPNPYNDAANNATIGYGHLMHYGPVNEADRQQYPNGITEGQGLDLLRQDASIAETAVRDNVTVILNQNQFDALTSFTFNVGTNAFRNSTLLRELNTGNYDAVPDQMGRWVNAGGRRLRGLENRRAAEGELFRRQP
jgi:RHS repeat-associated protein